MRSFNLRLGIVPFALAAALTTSAVNAADVLVTTNQGKGGHSSVAFDLSSAGDAVGFNFKLVVPGLDEKSAKLGGCVSELPKGWTGGCSATKGGIYVFATSDDVKVLPAGITPVGRVTFRADRAIAKAGESLRIEELFVSDAKGNGLAVEAKISD